MNKILITGATGYIGAALIKLLGRTDYSLVCAARNPQKRKDKLPKNAVMKQVDFANADHLDSVFEGVDVAFFLMHSLEESSDFEALEERLATHFVEAAKRQSVKKIIYLGGLIDKQKLSHSAHMRSRKKVGDILRHSGIPVIAFRASIILGSGSISFEMIRNLVERLPVMVTPTWVRVKAQPIYINTVLAYLEQAIEKKCSESIIVEIGGKDVMSYEEIMTCYASVKGLKRWMIPVPFLTPKLSSLWLALITPLYAKVGRKLIESITEESVVKEPEQASLFDVKRLGCEEAIRRIVHSMDE